MFVRIEKGGKDKKFEYVVVLETYRDENGKVRQRAVERLGRKDLLLKKDPHALEKLHEKYGGSRQEKDSKAASMRVEESIPKLESPRDFKGCFSILKYGHYPVRALWRNLLELHRKFDYEKKNSRLRFDLDGAACFLTASKILSPSSVLRTYGTKEHYLGVPTEDVPLDSLYDLYGLVKKHKDSLMKWVGKALGVELPGDRASLVFYDVTNACFESALTDAECGNEQKDYPGELLSLALKAREEGWLGEEYFDRDGNPIVDSLPSDFLELVAQEKIQYLRMRGPSKEHRYDLPIVSVALVIDKYGVPLDFEVFAGNSSEFSTVEKAISRLQSKYSIRNAVVVADRGLNSGANLRMLQDHKLGFLMAQKVSSLGRELTKKMLDENLYQWFDPGDKSKGRYQLIRNWEKGTAVGNVNCSLVLTFNEKRKKRDEAILRIWRELVLSKQKKGLKVKPKANGWSCLAKVANDLRKGAPIMGVDEDEYNRRLALCGYAALIYRDPPADGPEEPSVNENELSLPAAMADCYHQLNQIEDCFRAMKTNLGLRPMFVWNSDHVKGHVCLCVLALILVRIIQLRLKRKNCPMSIHNICRTLNEAELVAWRDPSGTLCLHPVDRGADDVRNGDMTLTTEELLELVESQKGRPKPIDVIMEVCGLTPLKGMYNRNELSRSLGTQFKTEESVVGKVVWRKMS